MVVVAVVVKAEFAEEEPVEGDVVEVALIAIVVDPCVSIVAFGSCEFRDGKAEEDIPRDRDQSRIEKKKRMMSTSDHGGERKQKRRTLPWTLT